MAPMTAPDSASRHSTPPGTAANGRCTEAPSVVIARSCGVRSGTYLSLSMRLLECVPIAAPAFAAAIVGIRLGTPTMVLLTSVRPARSSTNTEMSLKPLALHCGAYGKGGVVR